MKNYPIILLMLLSSALRPITSLNAQTFPPASPATRVVDGAGILKDAHKLSQAMLTWEKERGKGIQMELVTVSSLEGEKIDSYAEKLFDAHGIGKRGVNNGLLILVAPTEGEWRIEVGYGLEHLITDADAYRIGNLAFSKQEIAKGNYDASLLRAIWALEAKLSAISKEDSLKWREAFEEEQKVQRKQEFLSYVHIGLAIAFTALFCYLIFLLYKKIVASKGPKEGEQPSYSPQNGKQKRKDSPMSAGGGATSGWVSSLDYPFSSSLSFINEDNHHNYSDNDSASNDTGSYDGGDSGGGGADGDSGGGGDGD